MEKPGKEQLAELEERGERLATQMELGHKDELAKVHEMYRVQLLVKERLVKFADQGASAAIWLPMAPLRPPWLARSSFTRSEAQL